jgi:Reverse transcriptase (RNA-dependent DNA polymerase)
LERIVVRQFIYPALLQPHTGLDFSDQFAFRPSGSTTASIVAMLHAVRTMLSSNDYVRVLSFDFSKAFDRVRHASLMEKLAKLDMPDSVYNWMLHFFTNHAHRTSYAGETSADAEVLASIVQGSALGPASYLVTAADLRCMTATGWDVQVR